MSDLIRAYRKAALRRVPVFRRCRRDRRRSLAGTSLIEFAVALSVLLLLMMGIAEFGAIYKDLMVLNQATREGARIAAVGASTANVETWVRSYAPTLDTGRITVATRYSSDDGANFTQVPGVEDGRNNVPTLALIRVHTEYPHRLMTGIVLPGRTEVTLRCDMIMQRQ